MQCFDTCMQYEMIRSVTDYLYWYFCAEGMKFSEVTLLIIATLTWNFIPADQHLSISCLLLSPGFVTITLLYISINSILYTPHVTDLMCYLFFYGSFILHNIITKIFSIVPCETVFLFRFILCLGYCEKCLNECELTDNPLTYRF